MGLAPIPFAEIEALLQKQDPSTTGFQFLRTAYKVKDPRISIKFYNATLGLTLLNTLDMPPKYKATFYSLGYVDSSSETIPTDPTERHLWALQKGSVIELMHEWGTENLPDFQYNQPGVNTGFNNITLMVPDVPTACARLESLNVDFILKPDEEANQLQGIAFFKDPDGYTIEMYDVKAIRENVAIATGGK